MHNNPNMDSESPLPDSEDWQIALEPYFSHPETALGLARQFATIRQRLKAKPPDVLQALDSLDLAVEALFEHTRFQSGAFELYETVIEGRATRADETLAESLGVKL